MRPLALLITILSLPLGAADSPLGLERVTGGLNQPVSIASAGDGRLFVVEQHGRIAIVDGNGVLPAPFLDLKPLVSCCGERGLLGLAFHPLYAQNGLFFVDYTAANGDVTVARYRVSSDPNTADPSSGTILLTIAHSEFANHNGGQLQFGPDGYLYIGVGDGGSGGDPHDNAQNLNVLLGKILRIDVDHAAPYAIPPSNPFAASPAGRPEIWAYGLRNPWRFSFDRDTGDLWIGDVGQSAWEEIDLQPASSGGGTNYGWRRMEGEHCYNPSADCRGAGMMLPLLEYDHSGGACAVTGGYRYRGARYGRMRGMYFYADYCSGTIFGAYEANGAWSSQPLLATGMRVSSFGEDAAGELYVTDYAHGVLYHLIDPASAPRRRAVAH